MAFRFKLQEPMEQGIRRIATQQIDRAVTQIEAATGAAAPTSVHETRKSLKRARALLRFARPLLASADFKLANSTLRDVGKALSSTRDFDVLSETLAKLQQSAALKAPTAERLSKFIYEARTEVEDPTLSDQRRPELIRQLHDLRAALSEMPIAADDKGLATAGIAACITDCRKDFENAFSSKHDEAFHDWRKTIQLHWRQMQLVERAWPAYCRARIDESRALSMLIGTDRDLAMLAAFAAARPLPKAMQREIARLVADHQAELRLEAKARGERLLAEGTDGFCRRLETYWAAAVQLRTVAKDRSHHLPGRAAIGA